MLSRRVVRVKVMQLLYAQSRDPELTTRDLLSAYQRGTQKNLEFYLYNLYYTLKIAEYALKDVEIRKKKLLRTPEDNAFVPKIYQNKLVESLVAHPWIKDNFRRLGFDNKVEEEVIRKYYAEFVKTEEYQKYIIKQQVSDEDTIDTLLALYRTLQANESFNDDMEDYHYSWEDDKSLVTGAIKKTLKALPALDNFYTPYLPDDEVVTDFGLTLLKKVALGEKELVEIIEPHLRNWDADRVAIIDMIFIKMGLAEFLDFPTIPTKVTLNEYVELTKLFSTEKSKDFVNGILDRILKKLQKDEKIVKEGRGLID
jgi:transcription antitermination protein NusB